MVILLLYYGYAVVMRWLYLVIHCSCGSHCADDSVAAQRAINKAKTVLIFLLSLSYNAGKGSVFCLYDCYTIVIQWLCHSYTLFLAAALCGALCFSVSLCVICG